jgi:hypothetical protein
VIHAAKSTEGSSRLIPDQIADCRSATTGPAAAKWWTSNVDEAFSA